MDSGRQDLADKFQQKATPDSSKSTTDKIQEGFSDTTDKVQRDVVPDSQKSGGQSFLDKTSRETDQHTGGESFTDKAKHALGMDKK